MTGKPNFQMSADARLIYQRFTKVGIGETIPYTDLEAEVSRPLAAIRGALTTALRRALRDDGMVFANVRGVGYLRCRDVDIVDRASADTAHIRRSAKRAAERLTKVRDYAALDPAKQLEHTTRLSILSAVATATRETSVNKVRDAAKGRTQELPLAETMRAFLS
jgi:hypothetical protein